MEIKGLKKIAGESKSLKGFYSPEYLQLNYNKETGEAWADFHHSLGHNSWNQYDDENILFVGNICEPMTMAQIKEMIENKLERG